MTSAQDVLSLPPRRELVIRGVHAVTMDPAIGDLPSTNIHIRDGEIVAINSPLETPDAHVIDGSGMIALPGFIDTHTHLWSGLFRSLVLDGHAGGYNQRKARLGPHFQPQETYWATVYGLVEAISSGITSLQNWAHNIRCPEDADVSVKAQLQVGMRGRFSYGAAEGLSPASVMNLDDVARMKSSWFGDQNTGSIDLGMALRGPALTPETVYAAEWELARGLGLPVTIHYASYPDELQRINVLEVLDAAALLDVDLQLVHSLYATAADRQIIRAIGASVSCAPIAVLRHGLGFPPIRDLLDDGLQVSLSLDTASLAGSLDMFSTMRTLLMVEHGHSRDDAGLQPRTVLALATIEGARDLDIDHLTGSLTPGKRADLILVGLDRLSSQPILPETIGSDADICTLLVYSGSPSSVDTVIADGRVLKSGGHMTSVDTEAVTRHARAALSSLLARA